MLTQGRLGWKSVAHRGNSICRDPVMLVLGNLAHFEEAEGQHVWNVEKIGWRKDWGVMRVKTVGSPSCGDIT